MKESVLEAEKSVVGALLIDSEYALPHCIGFNPVFFGNRNYQEIFKTCLALAEQGEQIDILTLKRKLPKQNSVKLYACIELTPTARQIKNHLSLVQEAYNLRLIEQHAKDTLRLASHSLLDVPTFLSNQRKLSEGLQTSKGNSFCLDEAIRNSLESISDKNKTGLKTGFRDLDSIIGGLMPSHLIIIGGRPSMGKTALSVSMIVNLIDNGKRVLYFSLEMSVKEIIRRILAQKAGVNLQKLKNGTLTQTQWGRITQSSADLFGKNLIIDDRVGISAEDILGAAYKYHSMGKLDAIFIDYLQIMAHKGHTRSNRTQDIGDSLVVIKKIAKELDIPVVLLSQLSRESERRDKKTPLLSDLRDSGNIEQDANIIIFPFRPEQAGDKETRENPPILRIAKHRDGEIGDIPIDWVPHLAMFRDKRY